MPANYGFHGFNTKIPSDDSDEKSRRAATRRFARRGARQGDRAGSSIQQNPRARATDTALFPQVDAPRSGTPGQRTRVQTPSALASPPTVTPAPQPAPSTGAAQFRTLSGNAYGILPASERRRLQGTSGTSARDPGDTAGGVGGFVQDFKRAATRRFEASPSLSHAFRPLETEGFLPRVGEVVGRVAKYPYHLVGDYVDQAGETAAYVTDAVVDPLAEGLSRGTESVEDVQARREAEQAAAESPRVPAVESRATAPVRRAPEDETSGSVPDEPRPRPEQRRPREPRVERGVRTLPDGRQVTEFRQVGRGTVTEADVERDLGASRVGVIGDSDIENIRDPQLRAEAARRRSAERVARDRRAIELLRRGRLQRQIDDAESRGNFSRASELRAGLESESAIQAQRANEDVARRQTAAQEFQAETNRLQVNSQIRQAALNNPSKARSEALKELDKRQKMRGRTKDSVESMLRGLWENGELNKELYKGNVEAMIGDFAYTMPRSQDILEDLGIPRDMAEWSEQDAVRAAEAFAADRKQRDRGSWLFREKDTGLGTLGTEVRNP